jgi:hypothetical protein
LAEAHDPASPSRRDCAQRSATARSIDPSARHAVAQSPAAIIRSARSRSFDLDEGATAIFISSWSLDPGGAAIAGAVVSEAAAGAAGGDGSIGAPGGTDGRLVLPELAHDASARKSEARIHAKEWPVVVIAFFIVPRDAPLRAFRAPFRRRGPPR